MWLVVQLFLTYFFKITCAFAYIYIYIYNCFFFLNVLLQGVELTSPTLFNHLPIDHHRSSHPIIMATSLHLLPLPNLQCVITSHSKYDLFFSFFVDLVFICERKAIPKRRRKKENGRKRGKEKKTTNCRRRKKMDYFSCL